MAFSKNGYAKFKEMTEQIYIDLLKEYEEKISNASEEGKPIINGEYQREMLKQYNALQFKLGVNSNLVSIANEECKKDIRKKIEDVFNEKLELVSEEGKDEMILQLSNLKALDDFYLFVRNEGRTYLKNDFEENHTGCSVFWKGTTDLEFVQLIYALKEAGLLNNQKNEIISLVEETARMLNYKLGKYWQSNLSDCINNRNADYKPPIFYKLIDAFNVYRQTQIEKRKKHPQVSLK